MIRECQIGRVVPAAELQLAQDLVSAWWPARYKDERVVIGTLREPGKSPCDVMWTPNYGVICPDICTTNGSWVFLVECCEPGTIFTPLKEKKDV